MVLKNYIVPFLLCSTLLNASDSALSASKKEQIEIDTKIDSNNASNLKYEWIKPIVASYSYSVSDQFSTENRARYFRISLDQPLFKSGGIYFAIKYANASQNFAKVVTSLKEKNLIHSLYTTLLNLQKSDLQIEKLAFQVNNAKLDIARKKEQFESGLIDSSFLDSAILAKSQKSQLLLDAKQKRFALLQQFKILSDVDYHTISLPSFGLVEQKEFIDKNLELQKLQAQKVQARYLKNMTISNYLPTLSLFGEYTHKKDSFRMFQQNNESKQYGLRISMPILDINRGRTIEIRKLEYLKSKILLKEKRIEIANSFKTFHHDIEILKQREALALEDSKLYEGLVHAAMEGVEAGEKTSTDVETLENSRQMALLEEKIYKLEIQESFVDLYAKMRDEI
jgi:outer membrane protein TolC